MAKLEVLAFKESGKFGYEHEVEMKPEHAQMETWDLADLIVENAEEIQYLSPVSSGFKNFFFVVRAMETPDYVYGPGPSEGRNKWLLFHLDRVNDKPEKRKKYQPLKP